MHLRTLRQRRGWTQAQLATKSGIAQNTISRLEHNPLASPSRATVVALGRALSADPLQIRFGPDPRQKRTPVDGRRRALEVPARVSA